MSQLSTKKAKLKQTFSVKMPSPSKIKRKLPGRKNFEHKKNNRLKVCQQKILWKILFQ